MLKDIIYLHIIYLLYYNIQLYLLNIIVILKYQLSHL